MTMGPEPMTSILWMSVRLGMVSRLLHELYKAVEARIAVRRAGRALRAVLGGEQAILFAVEALHGVIQYVHVRKAQAGTFQRTGVHGVVVVLGGDGQRARFQTAHRVVAPVVAAL